MIQILNCKMHNSLWLNVFNFVRVYVCYFQGMYFVSCVLLMRMNMPIEYRLVVCYSQKSHILALYRFMCDSCGNSFGLNNLNMFSSSVAAQSVETQTWCRFDSQLGTSYIHICACHKTV